MNTPLSPELVSLVSQPLGETQAPAVDALIQALLARYGESVQAIVLYGSCLRHGDVHNGLVDFYVLVDTYGRAYHQVWHRVFNTLLPPNVFYLALPEKEGGLRAKYAILSLTDFQKSTSMRWFHSYFWGRFCQPTHVAFAKNREIACQVWEGLAQAAVTFCTRVLPLLTPACDAKMLWQTGLARSYRAELRAERPETIARLYEGGSHYFESVARIAMTLVPFSIEIQSETFHAMIPSRVRFFCRVGWVVRTIQGKLLSLLRLIKGLMTFRGGVDYIVWKIQRHSGITIEVTPRLRQYPLLAGWVVMWRLYRKGAFR